MQLKDCISLFSVFIKLKFRDSTDSEGGGPSASEDGGVSGVSSSFGARGGQKSQTQFSN